METIGISPRFFTHELNNYSDWKQAFWRELFQNSVDAGATCVEITVAQIDGTCEISFADNGPGMDERTMRDIYFQLGATGKDGADTIGGHGRARILTCFAHQNYTVRTQNLLCSGQGGNFEIDNMLPIHKGCIVSVGITEENSEKMEEALRDYLFTCQMPCRVSINGEETSEWLYRRRATRALTFGSVHTTKRRPNSTVVRVRGVTMFERYSGCPTGTILEIEAARAREILTVSRDGLKYSAQKELDTFLAEITVDNKSVNRDCSVNKTEIFGPFRRVRAALKETEAEACPANPPKAALAETGETVLHMPAAAYLPGLGAPRETGPAAPIPYSVHYEDAPRAICSSAKRFHPENISGNRLKLLAAWDATIQFVLEAIGQWRGEETLYLPGFNFGGALGMHKEQSHDGGKGHIICINPLDEEGRIRVSCHDHATLYATAVHECAHVLRSWHDEEYAALQTELTTRTVGRLAELRARTREAVAAWAGASGAGAAPTAAT